MFIENKVNSPFRIVYFDVINGKNFFLPIYFKKKEAYILYNDKFIFLSNNLKEYFEKKDLSIVNKKDDIIEIILNNRNKIKNNIKIIKIKKIKNLISIKNIRYKKRKNNQKINIFSSMIFSYAKMSQINIPFIEKHLENVKSITKIIINDMQIKNKLHDYPKYYKKYIIIFSVLYNIGKIAIPKKILYGRNKLSEQEFEIYKTHVSFGVEMVKDLSKNWNFQNKKIINIAINIVKYHHELLDGSGYPQKYKKQDIPLEGRIISIIDYYLKNIENNKSIDSHNKILSYFIDNSNIKYDKYVIKSFISKEKEIYNIISK